MDDHNPAHHIDLLAYFITFRCYGTWLPGDERGWVNRQHNVRGTPMLPPRPALEDRKRGALRHPPARLTDAMRVAVEDSIRETCAYRDWELAAVNARTNHVHMVVSADGMAPEEVMRQVKAWATRRSREAGLWEPRRPLWSDHGSTVYLWSEAQVQAAVWYVLDGQDKHPGDSAS
ncbi:MAG: transposase [Dehalococcoidia bacterium]